MKTYHSPYSLNDDLTPEQFNQLRLSGNINPEATYQDYLELRCEREERKQQAMRLGLTGDAPPELTAEDEAMLDRAWAAIAAENNAAKDQSLASSGVA